MTDQNNTIQYSDDYVEIRALMDAYTDIVNRRSWEQIPDIFSEDASWHPTKPVNMVWSGLAVFRQNFPRVLKEWSFSLTLVLQSESTSGLKWCTTASAFVSEVGRNNDTGESIRAIGTYDDILIKEDGKLKFLERAFTLKYFDNQPMTGKLEEYKY